ncbi:MAG TPA: glycogen/starch synthase [Phycisphaerae bacterium]|nr:glycogen/starch synthase [Phycisphaerae bacterium]HOJ73509.1 glycogen/starch synthase [Phycisphaerae bacterium]HOM51683.1 glycogen/starch synthase [Phycisphaerae bacterium]HON68191.1 glycogen/starch synthase [Phycisphaerae bacterium]HOQ86280.1 glycogen/starch synthase [Phycisphaerae bacterium]
MSETSPTDNGRNLLNEQVAAVQEPSTNPLLFEAAWEVCSQTGGIYTVLRSKAPAAVTRWGDNYVLIGPYHEAAARIEFEPAPLNGIVGEAVEQLRHSGVEVHTGRWLITGRPRVILINVRSAWHKLGEWKYYLWKDHGITVPDGDWQVEEYVAFGNIVADLLVYVRERAGNQPMLAHFHEWQAAVAIPRLKHRQAKIPLVFTTHATLVGRSLSAANVDLYDWLPGIDGEAVAREHQIYGRFQIEKAAAHACDIFTTVSGITALEAEQFLGRKPDVLTPNGLNVERFAAPYQFQNLHRENKELIHEFVMGHFFPSYTFDLDRTLYIFTAGRYEYRNKGFDVVIEALYQLNQRLKADPQGMTVVCFIIAPAPYRALNVTTLNRQAMFHELRDTCMNIREDMGRRLFRAVAHGRMPTLEDLIDEFSMVRIKRMGYAWRQGPPPTIVTHDLVDDANDQVLNHLRHRNLLNWPDDPVKVVFHPQFITSTSPVLGLEYDQFVRGCNLGVFPSYYEPWGYTPMECVIRGIPAITSDLSGFGAYVMSHFPDHDDNGIFVARRRGATFASTTAQVTSWLYALTRMSRRERIAQRNRVESHAEHFDWSNMSQYYRAACRRALQMYYPDQDVMASDEELARRGDAPMRRPNTRRGRHLVRHDRNP